LLVSQQAGRLWPRPEHAAAKLSKTRGPCPSRRSRNHLMTDTKSVLTLMLLLTALPGRAFGLATEQHGNQPIGPGWNIAGDVLAVANLPSRVYWREVNGDPHFFFRGNVKALNQTLEQFARIGGEKEVLLLPGPSDVRTLVERRPVPCDWELHAPGG